MSETDMSVATEILRQLGGNRFLAMTGAKHLLSDKRALRFILPACQGVSRNPRRVVINLDASDTYTITVQGFRGFKLVGPMTERSDVYCDNLQEVFTSMTGLYTRL